MTHLTLDMTCSACPEQYDVKLAGMTVGLVHLRHGSFTVDGPDGTTVFARTFPLDDTDDLEPEENGLPRHHSDGIFENPEVRDAYLAIARRKIAADLNDDDDDDEEDTDDDW